MVAPLSSELFTRQEQLQGEAAVVRADLRLDEMLEPIGRPIIVGSAALGLMVWRDLDITVVCPSLEVATVASLGASLATSPRIRQVQFRNDTGQWNTDATYPDGLYLGLRYRWIEGQDWNVDVWFVDEPDRQPDLRHLRELPDRLDAEARSAILRVKDAWAGRPEYGSLIQSYDIYTAVIDSGVRTLDEFDAWRVSRRA